MQARFAELSLEAFDLRPAEFGELVTAETEKWAKVVRFAGVKAE